ncbi:MAG: helix-turn-helix domain-containing protein [Pseudomonadota bacterium]
MLTISEVAKRSGQPASTLRYYEERGLIQSSGRHGLKRVYEPEILERLALIALGRGAGFSLDEIRSMFAPEGPNIDRQRLRAKAKEIDRLIRKLEKIRDSLRSTAACPEPDQMQCANFKKVVTAAGRGEIPPLFADMKGKRGASSSK